MPLKSKSGASQAKPSEVLSMDKRDFYIVVVLASLVWGIKAHQRLSYLEGQQYVFDMAAEAEGHVCGPYEQPIKGHN